MIRNAHTGSVATLIILLTGSAALAQFPTGLPKAPTATMSTSMATTTDSTKTAMTTQSPADSAATQLDAAVAASSKGDKAATTSALNAGIAAAEAQANTSKGDMKGKLLNQVGNLKKLVPGVSSGLVGGGVLSKAVSLVKMALGANQISNLLGGGGSLLGSVGSLTSGLGLMQGALPGIGGAAASSGGSLISTAMSGVSKLSGMGGAAAEPAVKQQLGSVLNFAKGIL